MDPILRKYCSHPETEGFSASACYDLDAFLETELSIPYDAAERLARILIQSDPADVRRGGEPFYDDERQYCRRVTSPGAYFEMWEKFSRRIKHQKRFFDDESRSVLADIIGGAEELPIIEAGPGTRIETLVRARRADSRATAEKFMAAPAKEIGPPPVHLATAGRMNAHGIVNFYGALSAETAIAEVRPAVGGLVVSAAFRPTRALRLLDLSRIDISFEGSIFASDHQQRAARCSFLKEFHSLIVRPIQPHEEALEYIPTQAVAEYISNVVMLDGILYISAQSGAIPEVRESEPGVTLHELSDNDLRHYNAVLFGKSGEVLPSDGVRDLARVASGPALEYIDHSACAVQVKSVVYQLESAWIGEDVPSSDLTDITDSYDINNI